MLITTTSHKGTLDETLADEHGVILDMGCDGNGRCGRCKVSLTDGKWEIDGKNVQITGKPVSALACRTRLLSHTGKVSIPHSSLTTAQGQFSDSWHTRPLPESQGIAAAIDIGTTTIAAVKLTNGKVTARASTFNSQNRYGDNVLSRISHASTAKGLEELRAAVVSDINSLLRQLGDTEHTAVIAVAGNTVMSCLFHGIDPASIGAAPFTMPCRDFPAINGNALGLISNAMTLTVPPIASYTGGDLTAGLGEISLEPGEMLVDMGTNCEILLNTGSEILCTAAAAGPAFEGTGISCATRAMPGAIDHIRKDFSYTVIGSQYPPAGLCGSALVDFLAAAAASNRITKMGRFQPKTDFMEIAPGMNITEKDVEQLLKAKAAVFAGIQTLSQFAGTPIKHIYLAGGFANFLNTDSAVAIGMLPDTAFTILGNASLAGAARLACTPQYMEQLSSMAGTPREIHLNDIPSFENNYIDALFLK